MLALKTDTDIPIAGAGPTGLALAAELTRRGVSPLIIDRQPAGANTSRACVVHARTMEVLEPLGVTRELLTQGVKVPIFRVRDRDRVLITIDFSQIGRSAAPWCGHASSSATMHQPRRSKCR
jgi:2-polyprenyl-6-methoxyphenol hydroxylase-like FAD-dependent oxidoreductase